MAGAKKIIKRAARAEAQDSGLDGAYTKRYVRQALTTIGEAGVSKDSKKYRKQLSDKLSLKQRRKVRRYDRKG